MDIIYGVTKLLMGRENNGYYLINFGIGIGIGIKDGMENAKSLAPFGTRLFVVLRQSS
jgi:hypothetical protein